MPPGRPPDAENCWRAVPASVTDRHMTKTMIVAGFGPGISAAVAERFGKAGFQLALVARNEERLTAGAKRLEGMGIRAQAFPADLADPSQAESVVGSVRTAMGPIDAIAWVAYSSGAGDLVSAQANEARDVLGIATTSLLSTVKAALPDLRERKGAVLVANGGLGLVDERTDAMIAQASLMGLSLANAAKHKLVGMLAPRLRPEGVYVGEVMVFEVVKGTAFDSRGEGTLDPASVAAKFWEQYEGRAPTFGQVR